MATFLRIIIVFSHSKVSYQYLIVEWSVSFCRLIVTLSILFVTSYVIFIVWIQNYIFSNFFTLLVSAIMFQRISIHDLLQNLVWYHYVFDFLVHIYTFLFFISSMNKYLRIFLLHVSKLLCRHHVCAQHPLSVCNGVMEHPTSTTLIAHLSAHTRAEA